MSEHTSHIAVSMAADFESAREHLRIMAIAEQSLSNRNEATTRFHLIDRLLREILGWETSDVECEVHRDGEYADYILGNPRRFAVWEAKREALSFALPAGLTKPVCKIQTLRDCDPSLNTAIEQVQGYAQIHGLGLAVVCNGHQIVAFLGSRQDGVPPLEGNALCFTSLTQMVDRFQSLWDNLSKPGVESSFIYRTLRADGTPLPPEKLAASVRPYPGLKNRNEQQVSLKQLGELFLFDLATLPSNEEEFLRSCYASTGALSQHSFVSKRILETRYSLLTRNELDVDQISAAQTKHGLSAEFASNVVSGSSGDEIAAALKRRPIIVLGDVGVGKTVFLRHLIRVTAKAELEKAITLYVDFLKEPALSSHLSKFVQDRCEAQLREDFGIDLEEDKFVRDVYRGDLIRFARGVHGAYKDTNPALYIEKEILFLEEKLRNRAAHLKASLEQIVKARHRQIVLFLDNIDQRTPEFQEQVYVIGHALAETWPIVAFICMRPDTFYHSKSTGSLAAYQPRAFSISPPRIDLVIIRRLRYALGKMSSEGRMDNFPSNIAVNSPSLRAFLAALAGSLESNTSLIELIDNLSGRNVRRALDFVNTFIGSGHVDSKKIIEIQEEEGSYTVSEHEFLRAIMHGDNEYYDPSTSQVCNLFDISLPDGREHFLLPILLSFVERSIDSGEGYVPASRLFQFAQDLGFLQIQVYASLERAALKGLIETSPKYSTADRWEAFRITPIGAYSLKRLITLFTYLDAMVIDTPIVDKGVRDRVRNVHSIHQRIERFDLFAKYLEDQASKIDWNLAGLDWKSSFEALMRDANKTRRKAASAAALAR